MLGNLNALHVIAGMSFMYPLVLTWFVLTKEKRSQGKRIDVRFDQNSGTFRKVA